MSEDTTASVESEPSTPEDSDVGPENTDVDPEDSDVDPEDTPSFDGQLITRLMTSIESDDSQEN